MKITITDPIREFPRRSYRQLLACVGIVGVGMSAFAATSALAATDNSYCNGCQMYTDVKSTVHNYLTNSYVHYLGTGNRYLGAGSYDYANFVLSINEVSHPYNGTHYIRPAAQNAGTVTYVTVNAHGTY